ncbi:sugar kinase [Roseinatronobacter alkalisoli]|uniref:Sugar kinase n=1 Tax=Roseinatronobacter alkalisoli TaxID=3028235 RepID=A0ABT5TA77_9RHOB|nr:sugar kinase [Roseinatronobacter sp. HJB301]MDD7972015.1 sugar kinase [Roseinatronobacter sp. HJB301]
MPKILTVGEILVELVATTKGDGFRDAQPFFGPFPSGAPAIFVDQVGKIGGAAAIIGRVGDDDFGHLNIDRLARDDVDISGIEIAPGEVTGCAFVRYREDGSRAFLFTMHQSATAMLSVTPSGAALMESCDHLHIMGTALAAPGMADTALEALRRVKARGGTLSFDPNLRPELIDTPGMRDRLDKILAQTDIFMPSGRELFLFSNDKTEAHAVTDLLARGIREIVLKRGAQGASFFSSEERFDVGPVPVEEVDPTGAGDSFGGVYVALRLAGSRPADALHRANAAGALAVTRLGPMEGTSTNAEIDDFLKKQKALS